MLDVNAQAKAQMTNIEEQQESEMCSELQCQKLPLRPTGKA